MDILLHSPDRFGFCDEGLSSLDRQDQTSNAQAGGGNIYGSVLAGPGVRDEGFADRPYGRSIISPRRRKADVSDQGTISLVLNWDRQRHTGFISMDILQTSSRNSMEKDNPAQFPLAGCHCDHYNCLSFRVSVLLLATTSLLAEHSIWIAASCHPSRNDCRRHDPVDRCHKHESKPHLHDHRNWS